VAQHAVKLDLNYLVFLLGANDLFRANSSDDPLLRADAFQSDEPFALRSLLLRFQLPRRLRVLFNRLRGTEYYVASAGVDRPYFAARVGEVHRLPLLPGAKVTISAEALSDYEANIVSLSWLASAHGITPIFATQPMLWKSGMSASEEAVDWLAGTVVSDGSRYRVPSAEQARALESLNHRLLETCVRKHLKCLDLEKEIPRSTDAFYDSLHFNEAGAAMVAGHVARYVAREQ
jgi:hypothetical protein